MTNAKNMTERNIQARPSEPTQLAGFIIRSLALLCSAGVWAQTGPVLPTQPTFIFTGMTNLAITNTASETNVQAGRTFNQALTTNRFYFTYSDRNALLADGWSFMARQGGTNRDTEITNPANGLMVDYNQTAHPGSIIVPCDLGDLWTMNNIRTNATRNFLSRSLASNWLEINLSVSFNPTMVRQEAGICLYQDDDNFVLMTIGYSTAPGSHNGNTAPGNREFCVWEYGGVLAPSVYGSSPHVHDNILGGTTHVLRWDRYTQGDTNNCVQAWWSYGNGFLDVGDPYVLTGSPTPPRLTNPRIGIWTGCDAPATPGAANFTLNSLEVIAYNAVVGFSYSLLSAPTGASIDKNGIITWNPTFAQVPSTNVFVTRVIDDGVPSASTTNSFTVIFVPSPINTPPVLSMRPDVLFNVNNGLRVTNTATDADIPPNPLTYRLDIAPPGANIDSSGVITWTPNSSQVFTTNLFVTVVTDFNAQATNSQSLSATNTFSAIVYPPPWPAFVSPPPMAIIVNEQTLMVVTNNALDGNLNVPQIVTNSLLFNYSSRADLLAAGWSFIGADNLNNPRNTELSSPSGQVNYTQPGVVRIPCDMGDLWGMGGNTQNSLFRALPTNWLSARLAISFGPLNSDVQQAHLCLYQNDDNYVQVGAAYKGSTGAFFAMDREVAGSASTLATNTALSATMYFRLDRNPADSTITGYYSYDGQVWTALATATAPFSNPRLAIWTGGASIMNADQAALELRRLDLVYVTNTPAVLSYSVNINNFYTGAPVPGATIDTNGIIRWQTTEADGFNIFACTTVASENGPAPQSAINSFYIVVQEVNTAPVLPLQPDLVITSAVPLLPIIVTNTATDSDFPANSLSYALTSGPSNAIIDPNGIIFWIPTLLDLPSTNRFTTVVTDSNPSDVNAPELSATNSFSVILPPAPLPPKIQSPALDNGQAIITWNANVGALYRVQYKTSLGQEDWTDLPPDIRATTSTLTITNPMGPSGAMFFRVIQLPP
jgi:hypothetical protein